MSYVIMDFFCFFSLHVKLIYNLGQNAKLLQLFLLILSLFLSFLLFFFVVSGISSLRLLHFSYYFVYILWCRYFCFFMFVFFFFQKFTFWNENHSSALINILHSLEMSQSVVNVKLVNYCSSLKKCDCFARIHVSHLGTFQIVFES